MNSFSGRIAKMVSLGVASAALLMLAGLPLSAEGNGTGSGGAAPPPLPCAVAVDSSGAVLLSDGTVVMIQQ
ncbi:MAG TPA: hypothetical protein VGS41_00320 [Chthonomonadales bacterium]|nr:hypothetical protein [Chthonomonadales bacterium]